jgi:IclR family KDG regulon transcriptional repressor
MRSHIRESCSSMRNTKTSSRLSSVANAMHLLKSFSDTDGERGIGALATHLGLAKSTVHRLTTTLVQAGMLEQNPDTGKYRLGITIFELGALARRQMDFYNEAKDALRSLRDKTNESVHLAVLRGENITYINSLESPNAIKVAAPLGKPVPAHCCVEGNILLAFSAPQIVEEYFRARQAAGSIADPQALRDELAAIARRGYAIGNEEAAIGVHAIAAPFFGSDNNAVGAVGIAGPATRLSRRTLMSFLPVLSECVESLSRRLGASRTSAASVRDLAVVRS